MDIGHLAGPLLLESLHLAQAQVHMDRHQVAGNRAGEADGFETAAMQLAHQHHRWRAAASRRIGQFEQLVGGQPQAPADGGIVGANAQENSHQHGNGNHHHPSPLGEFAEQQHHGHHAGDGGPEAVDQGLALPAPSLFSPPVHHHAGLGKAEAQEHPHGIKGDQLADTAIEDDQQQGGETAEGIDAIAEYEPIAQGGELAGQIAIAGQKGSQPGEIGIGGVGRQQQNQQGGELQQCQQGAIAENPLTELVKQGGTVFQVNQARLVGQGADAGEHHRQQQHHHRQNIAGIAPFHRPEGGHAVADRFNARQGGATRAEGPHQQEGAKHHQAPFMGLGQQGLLAGHGRGEQQPLAGLEGTRHQQQKNHAHEDIGGQAQQLGARTDAPQVGQHHQEDRQQAKRHPLGLQAGDIGGEGGNARRRAHRHREHIINR